ncbi:MAG: hypothetical protein AB7O32_10090 [Vicinamibacterales bacterium]
MKRVIVAVLTLLAGVAAVQFAGGTPVDGHAIRDPLVERFLARSETPLRAYRAIRTLRAVNRRFHTEGALEAETEFSADEGFRYTIVRESGSALVRRRALYAVLREEQELWARGGSDRAALSPGNYAFGPAVPAADRSGERVFTIPLAPARREPLLVDGEVRVTEDGDLRAVSGRLVKNPSWWTHRVDVVREYARIAGVRVPVATRSTAHLRLVGRSEFEMTYRYESINGVSVVEPPTVPSGLAPSGPAGDAGMPSSPDGWAPMLR